MNEKGLISAIMPTFNRASWVLERIEELKKQTYSIWELIIVNDCSTDNTIKVLQPYLSDKIKLINLKQNSGSVSIPRAVGICAAKGEFIAPVDDDVMNLSNKFQDLINAIDDNSVLCYGNRRNYYPESNELSDDIKKPNWNPLEPNGWGIDNGQFIYRSNVYNKIPIIFPKRACDWVLAKSIKSLGEFKYVDKTVSIYQSHKNNRCHDESTKTKEINPFAFKEYFDEARFTIDYHTSY